MKKNLAFLALLLAVVACGRDEYKNIALLRAARHSSSADYNQTAQLVTDGLFADEPNCPGPEDRTAPRWTKPMLKDAILQAYQDSKNI